MDMTLWDKILGGGLLAGKKTYIVSIIGALTALGAWLSGDMSAVDAFMAGLAAFGIGSLRAGIAKS